MAPMTTSHGTAASRGRQTTRSPGPAPPPDQECVDDADAQSGVPMLLMGDEIGRTQQGNSNAYCQDSPLTWLDWSLQERNAELFRFCQRLIAFRQRHPARPARPAMPALGRAPATPYR